MKKMNKFGNIFIAKMHRLLRDSLQRLVTSCLWWGKIPCRVLSLHVCGGARFPAESCHFMSVVGTRFPAESCHFISVVGQDSLQSLFPSSLWWGGDSLRCLLP